MVVVVDGVEQGPDALIHDFAIPAHGLRNTHRRAQGQPFGVPDVFAAAHVGACSVERQPGRRKGDERAGSGGSEAAVSRVQDVLAQAREGGVVVSGGEGAGEGVVEGAVEDGGALGAGLFSGLVSVLGGRGRERLTFAGETARSNFTSASSWESEDSWIVSLRVEEGRLRGSRYFFLAAAKAVSAVGEMRRRWISGMTGEGEGEDIFLRLDKVSVGRY